MVQFLIVYEPCHWNIIRLIWDSMLQMCFIGLSLGCWKRASFSHFYLQKRTKNIDFDFQPSLRSQHHRGSSKHALWCDSYGVMSCEQLLWCLRPQHSHTHSGENARGETEGLACMVLKYKHITVQQWTSSFYGQIHTSSVHLHAFCFSVGSATWGSSSSPWRLEIRWKLAITLDVKMTGKYTFGIRGIFVIFLHIT